MYVFLVLISLLNFSYGGKLEVKDGWVRPAGKGMNTAFYFNAINNSNKADTLLSVKSSVAKMVQMHETFSKNGMMGMRQIKVIPIKAKSTLEFKPGGYHVMVMNLKKDLKIGSLAEFTLHFKYAGNITVKAPVKMPAD
ncbi:MAG: copper chaperone PCu(A)C [Ignavibacteriaceae bacterium]